jgi:hypothetical protein
MKTAGMSRERLSRVLLDLLLEMPGDVDDLLDGAESPKVLEDVLHHGLAGDLEHRLSA